MGERVEDGRSPSLPASSVTAHSPPSGHLGEGRLHPLQTQGVTSRAEPWKGYFVCDPWQGGMDGAGRAAQPTVSALEEVTV